MTDPGIEAFRRVTPEGELWGHTWTPKPQPTTRWWRAGELAAPPGNTDHYVSMGLTEQPGTERTRAKQADVTALLAGAWADVDVVSPWHAKPGLATTHDEALGALTAWTRPTVALRTPGGVQGFWLCETAIELEPLGRTDSEAIAITSGPLALSGLSASRSSSSPATPAVTKAALSAASAGQPQNVLAT